MNTETPGTLQAPLFPRRLVAKDIHLGVACRVPHRTRVPNVLQTGQNINSHGMLGVLVGTMVTCGELIGSGRLYEQLNKDSE